MLASKNLYRDPLDQIQASNPEIRGKYPTDTLRGIVVSLNKSQLIRQQLKGTFVGVEKWLDSSWFEMLQSGQLSHSDITTIESNLLPKYSYGLINTFGQYNYLMRSYPNFRFPEFDLFLANIGHSSIIHELLFKNEPTPEDIKKALSIKNTIELISSGTIVNNPDKSLPENNYYLVTDGYINDAILNLWGWQTALTGKDRTSLENILSSEEVQKYGYIITTFVQNSPDLARPQLDDYEWYDRLTIEHPMQSRRFDIYLPWDIEGKRRPPLIYSPRTGDEQIDFIDEYLAHLI